MTADPRADQARTAAANAARTQTADNLRRLHQAWTDAGFTDTQAFELTHTAYAAALHTHE